MEARTNHGKISSSILKKGNEFNLFNIIETIKRKEVRGGGVRCDDEAPRARR